MPETRAPAGSIDITTADFGQTPVAGYNQLRSATPISWQPVCRGFLLTRFHDVAQALKSPHMAEHNPFRGWQSIARKLGKDYHATCRLFDYMPFIQGGADHRRLRAGMARGVAPFAHARGTFERAVQSKLNAARMRGGFDLARDFAAPLLPEIMFELMGIGADVRPSIEPITHLSYALDAGLSVRKREKVEQIVSASVQSFSAEVERLLPEPRHTLLHTIHDALPKDGKDRVSDTAHIAAVMLLMGTDALAGCVTFAVHHLLTVQSTDPEAKQPSWGALSDDAIRFAPTVDFLTRVASSEVTIGGFQFARGDRVVLSPLSANHDPQLCGPDAGMIKPRPTVGTGLAFGAGAHVCIGARMVQNITRIAFRALSEMPTMMLSGPAKHNPGRAIRSLASLPIQLH